MYITRACFRNARARAAVAENHVCIMLIVKSSYDKGIVNQIYPPELQLNKANTTDTEVPFLDLHLSIANGFVSSKIYDKRDDFDLDIVNFPFLDGYVPRRASYGVYILLESAIMLRTSAREINI